MLHTFAQDFDIFSKRVMDKVSMGKDSKEISMRYVCSRVKAEVAKESPSIGRNLYRCIYQARAAKEQERKLAILYQEERQVTKVMC